MSELRAGPLAAALPAGLALLPHPSPPYPLSALPGTQQHPELLQTRRGGERSSADCKGPWKPPPTG